MKKLQVICITLFCMVSLVGCSGDVQKKVEDSILKKSGILEDDDYLDYQKMNQDGTLEDDLFVEIMNSEQSSEENEKKGKVHVTFGSNSNIQIEYYYDSSFTQPVDVSNCYLNQNDSLYANIIDCTSAFESLYTFSGYRIVEYDEKGNKLDELEWNDGSTNHVFQIPMEFKGCEISVVPVGKYEDCIVKLSDYKISDDGALSELGGVWRINGEKITSDKTTVSPVDALSVKYEYDESAYFFVSSVPVCHSAEDAGVVEFYSSEKLGKENTYYVELHPYIEAKISFGKKVDGKYAIIDSENALRGDTVVIDGKKEVDINQLRYGDKIVFTLNKECDIKTDCDRVSEPSVEKVSDEYIYTLNVSSEHMPNLSIILDESVGEDAAFALLTADISKNDMYYVDESFKSESIVVDQIVSLRNGIQVSVKDSLLGEQEAFKFVITKTDKDGNILMDTQYIVSDSQNKEVEILRDIATTSTYYKDIKVVISRMEAYTYKSKSINNGAITLKATDNGQLIPPGTVVDGNRNVLVTIKPNAGYYVDGSKNISGDSYTKEMTFSDYMKNIGKIIEDNPIKKYIDITLNVDDSYGTCTFIVDGKEESGFVKLKQNQKLVLKYKITNSDYQISYDKSGWLGWTNNFKSKKENDVTIELSLSLDGKTISRADYITVKKKGE